MVQAANITSNNIFSTICCLTMSCSVLLLVSLVNELHISNSSEITFELAKFNLKVSTIPQGFIIFQLVSCVLHS